MDALASPNASRNRDRVLSSGNSTSTGSTVVRRPVSQRDLRNGASIGQAETQSPAGIPQGLEGMLKNSTETGDIGMFSIRPSRLPPSLNTSRRVTSYNEPGMPRESFQPYGVPAAIDDRRRLPSYNRDTTSELISMYEGPSRQSSRLFEDPEYRSYSMTQASSQTLSNHRSYTSLRSQPEGNGLLQRPRSPFAYPTRLRRPGFRPSSPALTDGGGVDYRRRAEIDRTPYGGRNTSSPSSLYAHRRVPPPTIRPEFNRSTPSLLTQGSPTRASSSPLVHPTNANSSNDYLRRNGQASLNTSPARSILSLTSTVNLRPGNLPASTTTTPGKVSTPIYYDYTEEFDVEDYSPPRTREPPPQFQIESTIPEDRPAAMEQPTSANFNSRNAIRNLSDGHRTSSSTESIQQRRTEAVPELEPGLMNGQTQWPVRKASLPPPSSNKQTPVKRVEPQDDKLVKESFRISRLGAGAQELNSHVAEVFGLSLSESFGLLGPKNIGFTESGGQINGASTTRLDVGRYIQQSSQSSHLEPSMSRDPHEAQQVSYVDDVAHRKREMETEHDGMNQDSSENPARRSTSQPFIIDSGRRQRNDKEKRASSLDFTSARTKRPRSSGINSVDTGLTELAELISNLENAVRTESPENTDVATGQSWQTTGPLPTIPDPRILRRSSFDHNSTPSTSGLDQQRDGNCSANIEQFKQIPLERGRRRYVEQDCGLGDVPNFSHQIPRKAFSRSGSPILAPKPISPARELKLQNSVPQLMKALPPLPPYPQIQAVSPSALMTSDNGLPSLSSPSHTGHKGALTRDLASIPEPTPEQSDLMTTLGSSVKPLPTIPSGKTLPPSPPKMKLKVHSTTLGSGSASSEDNLLKLDQSHRVVQDGKPGATNLPKFKLRITRASNSSQGTVRINRDSRDLKRLAGLRNPKDFFTPPAGTDNIFRQVSRQIHTRKSSGNSSHGTTESGSAAISNQGSANGDGAESVTSPQLPKADQLNPSDVRSFFSDASSNMQGRHSLRKRISNFRARLAVPYSSRAVAQSLEDIPLRGQNSPDLPRSPVSRSVPDFHDRQSNSTEDPPLRNPTGRQMRRNLREKLLRWLKETRSAIAARVRPRASAAEGR